MLSSDIPVVSVDYVFEPELGRQLAAELTRPNVNPYTHYPAFFAHVRELIDTKRVPESFVSFCRQARERNLVQRPFLFIKGCPIDEELPVFDFDEPVKSKYALKKTFVGEGFLVLFANLMGTPAIGYKNVNGGDIVHDIYPQKSLYETQSQKTLKQIGFHKDLANHFVRPDFVNILAMRSSEQNEIFTTFVRCQDVVKFLGKSVAAVLREPIFYTPYDDLSVHGDKGQELGRAKMHPVLQGEADLVYFENRTIAETEEGRAALEKVNVALHKLKARVLMQPGDFVSCANNFSLHGKDVGVIRDPYQQKIRWSIKTVNVASLEPHRRHFKQYEAQYSYAVVDG